MKSGFETQKRKCYGFCHAGFLSNCFSSRMQQMVTVPDAVYTVGELVATIASKVFIDKNNG